MEEPAAVEQTEKMIPLSAVAPLLGWVAAQIRRDVERGGDAQGMPPMLVSMYDDAAIAADLPTSSSLFAPLKRSFAGRVRP